jgi:hypothetical protein
MCAASSNGDSGRDDSGLGPNEPSSSLIRIKAWRRLSLSLISKAKHAPGSGQMIGHSEAIVGARLDE